MTEHLELIIEPLTPVHVWDGNEYLVGLNVVVDKRNSKYYVVNIEKVFNLLSKEAISKITVANIDEIPKYLNNELLNIIYRGTSQIFLRSGEVIASIDIGDRVRLLPKCLIPGSSIKGLIRTALMYYELKRTLLDNPKKFKNMIDSGIDLSINPKNVAQGLEGSLFRKPRLRKQGGFVDSFQSLLISDPLSIEGVEAVITEFRVYELLGTDVRGPIAKLTAEALIKGKITYSITITTPLRIPRMALPNTLIPHLRKILETLSKLNIDKIKDGLSTFSKDLLNYEKDVICRSKGLREYCEIIKDLVGKVTNNCYVVRLGFMTGHMSKTIDLLLLKHYQSMYEEVKRVMTEAYGRVWDDRTVKLVSTSQGLLGAGWVRICIR